MDRLTVSVANFHKNYEKVYIFVEYDNNIGLVAKKGDMY